MGEYGFFITAAFVFVVIPLVILLLPFPWWQIAPSRLPGTKIGRLLGRRLDISFRNIALRVYFIAVYGGLFVVWGIPLFMMIVFWGGIILLIYRSFVQRKGKRLPLIGVIAILAGVALFSAGLLALARAGVMGLFFLRGNDAGGFLHFLSAHGDGARIDGAVGPAGIVAAFLWTFLDSFWRLRQAHQLRNLPTSTVRAAAVGLAEIKGTVRAVDPSQPQVALVTWDMNTYLSPKQYLEPFYLEDETGCILVDPTGCRIRAGWISDIGSMFLVREMVLTRHVTREDNQDRVTRSLRHGDPVYLIGSAEPSGAAGKDGERLVIRASARPTLDEALWRFFFGPARLPAGRDIYNVFFISDTSERQAHEIIMRGFKVALGFGALWLGLSVWLTWSADYRLAHYKTVEIRTPIEGGVFVEHEYWSKERIARDKARGIDHTPRPIGGTYQAPVEPVRVAGPRELGRQLRDENLSRVDEARQTLLSLGPTAVAAVPELAQNLGDPRTYVRLYSLEVLRSIGRPAAGARSFVAGTLDDPDDSVRYYGILALKAIGPDKRTIPVLIRALDDSHEHVRLYAVQCLEELGPVARPAVPRLVGLLKTQIDGNMRANVVAALKAIGLDYPEAVPILIDMLNTGDFSEAAFAARQLGAIGLPARSALPALRAAAEREKKYGHSYARNAVAAIEGAAPESRP